MDSLERANRAWLSSTSVSTAGVATTDITAQSLSFMLRRKKLEPQIEERPDCFAVSFTMDDLIFSLQQLSSRSDVVIAELRFVAPPVPEMELLTRCHAINRDSMLVKAYILKRKPAERDSLVLHVEMIAPTLEYLERAFTDVVEELSSAAQDLGLH